MSDNELLQAAAVLIRQRDYQTARTLLKTIEDHPTARQWLHRLDQSEPRVDIYHGGDPSPIVSADKQTTDIKLQAAAQLIREQQHHAARAILETIDHPTAREWLHKLDQRAPLPDNDPMHRLLRWTRIRDNAIAVGFIAFGLYRWQESQSIGGFIICLVGFWGLHSAANLNATRLRQRVAFSPLRLFLGLVLIALGLLLHSPSLEITPVGMIVGGMLFFILLAEKLVWQWQFIELDRATDN